jgi:hypothetical protein
MFLSKEDLDFLMDHYHTAKNTPCILLGTVDLATEAWNSFWDAWKRIATKYGIDSAEYGFNSSTGEIVKRGG